MVKPLYLEAVNAILLKPLGHLKLDAVDTIRCCYATMTKYNTTTTSLTITGVPKAVADHDQEI